MATNLVKFCAAALAGSFIAISYERWPHQATSWPISFNGVSATSSIVANDPIVSRRPREDPLDLDPQKSADNLKKLSKYGLPSTDNLRLFNDFVISYDRRLRAPVWVMEHLSPEKLSHRDENIQRSRSNFREDRKIHGYFRAQSSDFSKSGFDRGHMAAAGNHKMSQQDLDQTFILSNVSPQEPAFNRGGWERLETFVRWRAKRAKNLFVVTGPLYLPMKARDGKLYVTYRVIGNNQVSVPTHYFKVFLIETRDDRLLLEAFLMPNDAKLTDDIHINDYRVPISRLDVIERASGVIFFDQLDRNSVVAPTELPSEYRDEPRAWLKEERQRQLSAEDHEAK